MAFTFKRGINTKHRKLTENIAITALKSPNEVCVPLVSYGDFTAQSIVSAGDKVKKGQLIASGYKMAAAVFSPISGTVIESVMLEGAVGAKTEHIKIQNDFKEDETRFKPLTSFGREELLARIEECGIVGMGGAGFPTHIKLNPPAGVVCDLIIINAAECEPYLTCDSRVMQERTAEFLKGVELLKKAAGAKSAVIGIEGNKKAAIDKLLDAGCVLARSQKRFSQDKITVSVLKSKYPQGAEKQLIKAVCGRVQGEGKLPYTCGVCVDNVQTAVAVYEAVQLGKPLYERVVTVSGLAIKNPGNYIIKAGTLYSHIANVCGYENAEIVISGGPMMGYTVFTDKIASTNANGGVLFLTKKESEYFAPSPCIACGKCVEHCPMYLMPVFIDSNVLRGNYKESKKYGALSCIECGCCSYVCPAKKPLVQSIKLAKKVIKERGL